MMRPVLKRVGFFFPPCLMIRRGGWLMFDSHNIILVRDSDL